MKGGEREISEEEESEEGEIASCGVNARNDERKKKKLGTSPDISAATSRSGFLSLLYSCANSPSELHGKHFRSNKDRSVALYNWGSGLRNKCIPNTGVSHNATTRVQEFDDI